jgi:glycosyltransferase involved in cell wall biosynthesis
MRYAWNAEIDSRHPPLARPLMATSLAAFRQWDRRAACDVDHFAANSSEVRERIRRAYGRDAVVIAPPVDVDFFTPDDTAKEGFALAVSRFIPYKRIDIAIKAAARAGVPLVVAGFGPEEARLRRLADSLRASVRFEIEPSDERLRDLYRQASVLVFAAHEDFGIVPVEAQACGTPVIGPDVGGIRDTVIEGVTGRRLGVATVDAYAEAILAAFEQPFSAAECRSNAESFSTARFQSRLRSWLMPGG